MADSGDQPRLPETRSFLQFAASRHKQADWYRCKSCGFLARVDKNEDREVRAIVREAGMDVDGKTWEGLFCFVNAPGNNVSFEIGQLIRDPKRTKTEVVLEAVNKDRNCLSWYPHLPGASPLWHYESLRMMYLEAERRRHDERLEGHRREFQTEVANRDAAENHRLNRLATILTVAIGATGIVVAVIIGAIQIWLAAQPPGVVVHVAPQVSPMP